MNMETKLEQLKNLHADAKNSKAYGRLTKLFDDGTFFEIDPLARSGDGAVEVLAGYGSVDGCPLYAFAQNMDADGGAMSKAQATKIEKIFTMAVKTGAPVVGLFDSKGAKLKEGHQLMASYGKILAMANNLSGVVPQISLVMGSCQGTAALMAASTDLVIMTETAKLQLSVDGVGGTAGEAAQNGISALTAQDDDDAIAKARRLITLLPSNNLTSPDFSEYADASSAAMTLQQAAEAIAVDQPSVSALLSGVTDPDSALELQPEYGKAAVTALAKMGGTTCGLILTDGGALCGDTTSKMARFIRFCDAYSLPVVTFVNTAGIDGLKQAAQLTHAYSEATMVKIAVVTGMAVGAAFIALAGRATGSDLTLAWPTASISALPPQAAVSVFWAEKLQKMSDPQKDRDKLAAEYKETEAAPTVAAAGGFIDDVIDPSLTRARVISALDMLSGKRVTGLPKKHSNIQL